MNNPRTSTLVDHPFICDVCQSKLDDFFIEGRTILGFGGHLCLPCHADYGIGKGQVYQKVKVPDEQVGPILRQLGFIPFIWEKVPE